MNDQVPKSRENLKYTLGYLVSLFLFCICFFGIFFTENRSHLIKPGVLHPKKENFQNTSKEIKKKDPSAFQTIENNINSPISRILIQILVVVLLSRLFANLFKKIGQPGVIGEIIAGIFLGPSILGNIYPEFNQFLFPESSLENLHLISQFGLIIFMFIIGMELDIGILKEKASSAILISHFSILFPFILGSILSLFLFNQYAGTGVSFNSFGLFLGISMSITAFPVLARIIQEKGLSRTSLGSISLTCAAIDDISAWTILALIIAFVQTSSIQDTLIILLLFGVFILFMIYIIQPFLRKLSRVYMSQEIIGRGVISVLVLIVIFSSFITEILGIHALFGAFLAGVIMPNYGELRKVLTDKFEDFSAVLLLPLFFAFTGLRTQIGLLNSPDHWITCLIVILVATAGKLGGGVIAARYTSQPWKDSLIIGALMNTRGLMELIVLNIGYDMGILSPEIFTIMVIMALVTTLITGPIIDLIQRNKIGLPQTSESILTANTNRVLIAFGPAKSGKVLFKLGIDIFGNAGHFSAIHFTPFHDKVILEEPNSIKKKNFESILKISNEKKIPINTIFQMTNNITSELISAIHKEQSNYVLIGAANPIFGDNILSGKVETILNDVDCNVGIFLDKGFKEISSLLIFYKNPSEGDALFKLGGQIQKNGIQEINLVYEKGNEPAEEKLRANFQKSIRTITTDKHSKKVLNKFSLLIIGYDHWQEIFENSEERFLLDKNEWQKENNTSILIIRKQLF